MPTVSNKADSVGSSHDRMHDSSVEEDGWVTDNSKSEVRILFVRLLFSLIILF